MLMDALDVDSHVHEHQDEGSQYSLSCILFGMITNSFNHQI